MRVRGALCPSLSSCSALPCSFCPSSFPVDALQDERVSWTPPFSHLRRHPSSGLEGWLFCRTGGADES